MVLFQFCWLPSYIQSFLVASGYENSSTESAHLINLFTSLCGYAYAGLSPLVCFYFIQQYRISLSKMTRDVLQKLCDCRCSGWKKENTTESNMEQLGLENSQQNVAEKGKEL